MKSEHFSQSGLFIFLMLCCMPVCGSAQATAIQDNKTDPASYSGPFWTAYSACRFEEAMNFGKKYYETALLHDDQEEIFNSLNGMFALNRQMGNYENSFYYAQKLNDVAEKSG